MWYGLPISSVCPGNPSRLVWILLNTRETLVWDFQGLQGWQCPTSASHSGQSTVKKRVSTNIRLHMEMSRRHSLSWTQGGQSCTLTEMSVKDGRLGMYRHIRAHKVVTKVLSLLQQQYFIHVWCEALCFIKISNIHYILNILLLKLYSSTAVSLSTIKCF